MVSVTPVLIPAVRLGLEYLLKEVGGIKMGFDITGYIIVFVVGLIGGLMLYHKFRPQEKIELMNLDAAIEYINSRGFTVDIKQPYKSLRQ